MTHKLTSTPLTTPWDLATLYAASCLGFGGLFAPGLLMAARRHAIHTAPTSAQGQST